MNRLTITKKANAYVVEIDEDYSLDSSDDEVYFYKTREEMEADLPNVIVRAHAKFEEDKAAKAAKAAK